MNDPRRDPKRYPDRNVLGQPLASCSTEPITGFFRDGCCGSSPEDRGMHTVCAVMTAEFLIFSKASGNDLSTPRPEYQFTGLLPGHRWCVCAQRWKHAVDSGVVAPVHLEATHEMVLELIPLEVLLKHATGLAVA